MKVIMRIPLELSRSLITNVDRGAAEYECTANGLIQGKHLVLQCDDRTATEARLLGDSRVPGAKKRIQVLRDVRKRQDSCFYGAPSCEHAQNVPLSVQTNKRLERVRRTHHA